MRHKSSAQSLVEMAMILPLMLFIFFAIIDMGWYIYGYGTIYNAARRGAEKASQLPPWPSSLMKNQPDQDECFKAVYSAVQGGAVMFPNLANSENMSVNYVDPASGQAIENTNTAAATSLRQLGGVIQVSVKYNIPPLTPLLTLGKAFGFGGVDQDGNPVLTVSTVTRRTIESMGFSPGTPDGCPQ